MGPQDEQQFAAYVAARRDQLRRTAYLLCRDWHAADDLVQIALVKLYKAWDSVRDKSALDAFMRSTMARSVIDESRRPWRRESSAEELPEPSAGQVPAASAGADPAGQVVDRQVMQQALAQVPPGQRAVLVLRFYEGLDVAGTAAALQRSEGNVKSQTARGLAALRAALTELGADPSGLAGVAGETEHSHGSGPQHSGLPNRGLPNRGPEHRQGGDR